MNTIKKKSVEEQSPRINIGENLETGNEQVTGNTDKVSSEKMNKVLELLQDKYNLVGQDFELISIADKKNKVIATLSNADYDVQFTIKSMDIINALIFDK